MMAWHIFKKDLTLLWPIAGLSILAQWGLYGLVFWMDLGPQAQYLRPLAQLSVAAVFLALVFAMALDVQQEPFPGTRQDWLIRPIRRWDLLLAKLLFVLLVVHVPMVVGDVAGMTARGFPFSEAVGAAVQRTLLLFVTLSLPALALAAMTRTVGQFIAAGIGYFLATAAVIVLLGLLTRLAGQEQVTNPLAWTGVAWITQTAGRIALAAGSAFALLVLYLRRRIVTARTVFPVFALLSVLTALLPWNWIFALQQVAAAVPAPPPVAVAFEPAAPRYRLAPGESAAAYAAGAAQVQLRGRAGGDVPAETQARAALGGVMIYAPLRITGLPAGDRPWVDRATVKLMTASGQVLFQGRGDDLKLAPGATGPGPLLAYEAIRIPPLAYVWAKDQPVALQIELSLTVLEPQPAVTAPAFGSPDPIAGLGRCSGVIDNDFSDIELRCLTPQAPPSCLTAALVDPASGRRNPERLTCAPNYAPYATRSFPDSLSRFEVEAPFRDRLGVGAYPVGEDQVIGARVVVTPLKASAHLVRRISVPGLRLPAWTAVSGGAS